MFANEHIYDDIVAAAEEQYGVPASIIKAVIGEESSFRTDYQGQYRDEPELNDASYGPMQVLFRTAVSLGFPNDPTRYMDLMKPEINIPLGTKYLRQIIDRYGSGDVNDIYAAYNAGSVRKDAQGRYVNSKGNPNVNARVKRFEPIYAYFYEQEMAGTLLIKKA
jgi:soluble lytic murein transglycosylase-like protein